MGRWPRLIAAIAAGSALVISAGFVLAIIGGLA